MFDKSEGTNESSHFWVMGSIVIDTLHMKLLSNGIALIINKSRMMIRLAFGRKHIMEGTSKMDVVDRIVIYN
jgi:hypothetical protein